MGFTLQQYRDILRTDLKDSSTLWSDAELNRSVQRAVDDLSRFLPLELVKDITFAYDIDDESVTMPATASATTVVGGSAIAATSDGDVLAIADATPDVPRRLTVTLTDANSSVNSLTLIVKGYDENGYYIEESWYIKDFLVSGTAYQGKLYFKRVTEVEVENIGGAGAGDVISVGSGNDYDSDIFLVHRPIRPESETVTSDPAGTTYTRDTDYTMDYANGAIRLINGGDMAAGGSYLISYDKSRIGINISDLLPIVTRIQRVQYPADIVPQQFVSYNIIGDFMYIGSQKTGESQTQLTAKEHIHIYYERKHMLPGEDSPGSYSGIMDEIICVGASAFALLMKAYQSEHQAVTDAASARTALGTAADAQKVATDALVKVTTYLETNGTTDNAKDVLANITDDIGELRTAIAGALEVADNYLDEVDTTDLQGAEGVWTDEVKLIDGADDYLDTGDDTVNTVNVGENVPELYRRYADTELAQAQLWADKRKDFLQEATARTNAAMMYVQMAAQRLSNIRSYIDEAGGWIKMGETFISEAQVAVGQVDRYLGEAAQNVSLVQQDVYLADRWRTEGIEKRNEFWSILRDKSEYRRKTSSTPVVQPK